MSLLARIETLLEPMLASQGFELVDLEFRRERLGAVLRLYIDYLDVDRHVGLEECATLSREIGDLLDAEDAVRERYNLEVSSPGVDRPLRKPTHFANALGQLVQVKLRAPLEGRRNFRGRLTAFDGTALSVMVDKATFTLPFVEVEKANVVFVWEDAVARAQLAAQNGAADGAATKPKKAAVKPTTSSSKASGSSKTEGEVHE